MDAMDANSTSFNNSTELIKFLWKRKFVIVLITALGTIITALYALILPNEYKAQAVVFASDFYSMSKAITGEYQQSNPYYDIYRLGSEETAERYIEVVKSQPVMDHLFKKFDFYGIYGVSSENPAARSVIELKLRKQIEISKSKYTSISIEVTNKDPFLAANIANVIVDYLDTVVYKMNESKLTYDYSMVLTTLKKQQEMVNQYTDSLNLYISNKNSAEYYKFNQLLSENVRKLSFYQSKMNEISFEKEHIPAYKFIASYARVPELKDSPKRTIMVAFACAMSFFLSIMLVLLIDKFRDIVSR